MRACALTALVLLFARTACAQAVPAGWKVVTDSKSACRIAVPAEWVSFGENNGAAMLRDSTTALAVVTSQPGQEFKPLPAGLAKSVAFSREMMFENTPKHIFYQDKASRNAEDPNAFSASIPSKDGTCSVHVVALPSVPADIAKKIALSLAPADKT